MASPSMTFGAVGNVRASASLAASGTASYQIDLSAKIEGQITVTNTPGGTVAATRGVRVDFFPRYGSTPEDSLIAAFSYTMPSTAASTEESKTFFVGTGQWTVKVTNLDVTNAVTLEITSATVDGIV